jgi:haloacetate dehalogenase
MFEGFDLQTSDLGETSVRYRIGGSGPPVLLLHGFPQTHAIWHRVGPALAASHTVVAPDLRGYGGSTPPREDTVEAYSKRAMAADQVALMDRLGFGSFAVVGHDRGGRVGYRLALDHPDRVDRLAVLDIVPTAEMWRAAEQVPADQLAGWHWNTLARPAPQPEDELNADPGGRLFPGGSPSIAGAPIALHPDALADYLAALARPSVVHAICQDYRAGATVDREYDEQDLAAGNRIRCPVLVHWGGDGDLFEWFDVPEVWSRWTTDLDARPLPGGHFLPEESPDALAKSLRAFLGG